MKNRARTTLLLLGDIITLILAFVGMIYISFYGESIENAIALHILPFSILSLLWIGIFFIFNLYDTNIAKPTIPHLRQIFLAFIVALVVGIIFFYVTTFFHIAPKKNLLIFGGITILLFTLWRKIFYDIFASYFRKNVVFIVSGENNRLQVEYLKNYIANSPQSGFIIVGIFDSLEKFFEASNRTPEVFIISKEIWQNPQNFKKLYGLKSETLDLAHAYEDILGRVPVEAIDESWFMHNIRSRQEENYNFDERLLSTVGAFLVLIITSPLFLIAALLIKIYDRGPIFYSQVRVGRNGKDFKLYKFRTMIADAEKTGVQWSSKDDPRVTPVGRILRKTHIDELPQMINVLKGEIALVGPRPERPFFVNDLEQKIPFYHLRHTIMPGFTGWAQIKFRYAGNVMDSKEKFEYDLYYLKKVNPERSRRIVISYLVGRYSLNPKGFRRRTGGESRFLVFN